MISFMLVENCDKILCIKVLIWISSVEYGIVSDFEEKILLSWLISFATHISKKVELETKIF